MYVQTWPGWIKLFWNTQRKQSFALKFLICTNSTPHLSQSDPVVYNIQNMWTETCHWLKINLKYSQTDWQKDPNRLWPQNFERIVQVFFSTCSLESFNISQIVKLIQKEIIRNLGNFIIFKLYYRKNPVIKAAPFVCRQIKRQVHMSNRCVLKRGTNFRFCIIRLV